MKYIYITLTILFTLSCKAQSSTISIYDDDYGNDGVYYKDIYNDYNTFEGTWVYTNGTTSLTIVLQKKTMKHVYSSISNYYTDALIGEYVYLEDGIELINTLSNLSQNHENPYAYNIVGGIISKPGDVQCSNCGPNEKKVFTYYTEPNCEYGPTAKMIFRYYIENGIEKINCYFTDDSPALYGLNGEEPDCLTYKIPYGEYILIKQ